MAYQHLSLEQWQALIDEHAQSHIPQAEFCKSKGLSLSTFSRYRKLLRQPHYSESESVSDWIELPTSQSEWDLELSLPGGVTLRMRQN